MAKKSSKKRIVIREANAAVFYRAFRSFDSVFRRELALQILKDEEVIDDLLIYREYIRQRRRRVRWYCDHKGWSQRRVARKFGITQASISRILSGKQGVKISD